LKSEAKRHNLCLQLSTRIRRQKSDRDRQLEAAWAAGAGVEIEHAFLRDEIGDVGVAVKDGGELGGGGIEVQGFEVVEHVEIETRVRRVLDEDDFGFGQLAARAFDVDVAANGGDGSDLGELIEDGDFSYVATVEDAVDAQEGGAAQCRKYFGAKEAVGIRDDSEFHVFRISCAGGGRLREGAHAN